MLLRKSNDFGAGYYTSKSPLEAQTPKNALVFPSKNLLYDRNSHPRNFNGFDWSVGGGTTTFYLDNGWASLGSSEDSDVGSGNIFEYYNKSLIFVGTGTVKASFPSVNATPQVIGVASSTPQIAVLNDAGTGWETPRQMGLSPQGESPSVSIPASLGTGFTGSLSGVRAFKVAAVREETGALSNASPSSNVLEFTNSSAIIQMPASRLVTDGSNLWRLYCTPSGFGNVGFFQQVPYEIDDAQITAGTVNYVSESGTVRIKSYGVAGDRQLEVEFNDQDLLGLQAPEDQFAASAASFVSAIGNVVVLIGTFKGVGLSASNPNQPEAYPPDLASFMTETAIGVSRPTSGFLYILCQNSIWLAMMSGAVMGGSPVISRSFVNNIGVKNNKAAVTIGDDLYIFSSGGKPVRITADAGVDLKFGDRVLETFKNWDASKVVLSFDEEANRVIYCHEKEIMSFDRDYDRWNTPVDLDEVTGVDGNGVIVSAFTKDGVANVVYWKHTDDTYNIGKFDKGLLGSSWTAREAWEIWSDYRSTSDMIQVSAIMNLDTGAPDNIDGKIFRNNETLEHSTFGFTLSQNGMNMVKKPVRSYGMNVSALELSGTGFGHTIITLDSDVDSHNIQ